MKGGRPPCTDVIDRIDPSPEPHCAVSARTTKHRGGSSRPIDIVDVNPATGGAIRTRLQPKLSDGRAVQLFNLPMEIFSHARIEQKRWAVVIMKFIVITIVCNERSETNRGRIIGIGYEPALNDISWVERWACHQRVMTCVF